MDKISRKILKAMNAVKPDPAERYYNWHKDLEKLAEQIGETANRTETAVRYLIENKYLTDYKNQNQISLYFGLSSNGLDYKAKQQSDRWRRNVERLLVFISGILSAVIAELLVDLIRGL